MLFNLKYKSAVVQFTVMCLEIDIKMLKQFLIIVLLINCLFTAKSEIINTKVLRVFNIETQLAKIDVTVKFQNWGFKYVDKFTYVLDADVYDFYITFKNGERDELSFEKDKWCRNNSTCYKYHVLLDRHVAPNQTYELKAEVVYINQINPLYKTRTAADDHYVMYTGNLLFYSPYKTLLSKTSYMWHAKKDLTQIEIEPVPHQQNRNLLTYFYTNVPPFSSEFVKIVFVNNDPFLVVTYLERIIDVSHFGKISVEDRISLKNAGSKFVGPYEPSLNPNPNPKKSTSILYTHLPASADDVKFFDTIGNSSKSIVLHNVNYKTLMFNPRYPLLSGWKTFYVVKYTVPTYEYLYHDFHGKFILKMRVVDHILDDAVISQALVKVLLPEASNIIQVYVPSGFQRLKNEIVHTSLCTFGRPTVVFNGSNIVEEHIADFKVEYLFPSIYLLRVPLLIILYLEIVFICFIVISHYKF